MQAPADEQIRWPANPQQWGVMRVLRAVDVASYCEWLRFDTMIRGALHSVSDTIPIPRSRIARRAHMLVKHDRALVAFQKIEDAEAPA